MCQHASRCFIRLSILLFLLQATPSFAETPSAGDCKSSYSAVYKPSSKNPEFQGYEITIAPEENTVHALRYESIKVTKLDAEQEPVFELKMTYLCEGGAFPNCFIVVPTKSGKPIQIVPSALNKDFSYVPFIRDDGPPPYSLIFSGADQSFYYKSDQIKETHLKHYLHKKPVLQQFPVVWLLDHCKN